MGIAPHIAQAIIREHRFRRIDGDVLLLGRQTMQFSANDAVALVESEGLRPVELAPADATTDRRTIASQGQSYIRDDAFFKLLGNDRVRAIDHTDYEGAEIVHDLNLPIPDRLAGTADFILDGSTLDNMFNPAIGLQNITRLLRANGRFLSVNGGNALRRPYAIPTGYWFLDYCALNRFADCQVYLMVHDRNQPSVFLLDPLDRDGPTLNTSRDLAIVVIAEKDEATTCDRMPIQRQYAGPRMLEAYLEQGRKFARSDRPALLRSRANSTPTPSILNWVEDYFRSYWTDAFERVRTDGSKGRQSPTAATTIRQLKRLRWWA